MYLAKGVGTGSLRDPKETPDTLLIDVRRNQSAAVTRTGWTD